MVILKCTCKNGLQGTLCDVAVNCKNCKDFNCDSDGNCKKCEAGWDGPDCLTRKCPDKNPCGPNGA